MKYIARGTLTKDYASNENGRSMAEIIGVLAIVGILSIGGVAGYILAMNKHRANEILNASLLRAKVVSMQLLQDPNTNIESVLNEFEENDVGGAVFSGVEKIEGKKRFKIKFEAGHAPTFEVCTQMKIIAGDTSGIVDFGENCDALTYNNDLSATKEAADYKTPEECKAPYTWCSGWETPGCSEECCQGLGLECCDVSTGKVSSDGTICHIDGIIGECLHGVCVEQIEGKACNPNNYSGNKDCGGVNSGYYCYYKTQKCQKVTAESRATSKLKTDSKEGRGTDWYTAMSFCAAIDKKMPSLGDLSIKIPTSGDKQCFLSDCPDGGVQVSGGPCDTTTTMADIQNRFNERVHVVWTSNQTGKSAYVVSIGNAAPGYVYPNDRTSSQPLAVCE